MTSERLFQDEPGMSRYGRILPSVISGMMFYSRINAPYEIMGPSEREDDSGDPRGYQTEEDLMVYLAKLVSKAKEY